MRRSLSQSVSNYNYLWPFHSHYNPWLSTLPCLPSPNTNNPTSRSKPNKPSSTFHCFFYIPTLYLLTSPPPRSLHPRATASRSLTTVRRCKNFHHPFDPRRRFLPALRSLLYCICVMFLLTYIWQTPSHFRRNLCSNSIMSCARPVLPRRPTPPLFTSTGTVLIAPLAVTFLITRAERWVGTANLLVDFITKPLYARFIQCATVP